MIKVSHLDYTYKNGNKALKDINLEIRKNKITAIVGKNGSGKSTLSYLLAGIYYAKKGEIVIDDMKISKKENQLAIRKKIGIVFQNPENQIIFDKVEDDMKFTLKNHQIPAENMEERMKEALKKVEMLSYKNANLSELSLGQKQRIAIANNLAIEPDFLILDEATAMLDPKCKKQIYQLINQLKEQHITVILVTNIIDEILVADDIVIIDEGKIIDVFEKEKLVEKINLLQNVGLDIPFVVELIQKLKEKGITINLNETREQILQNILRSISI